MVSLELWKGQLVFVSLFYIPMPASLVHIDSTFGAVVNMGSGFFAISRTFHDSLPLLSFSFCPSPSGLAPFPLSPLESVT